MNLNKKENKYHRKTISSIASGKLRKIICKGKEIILN